MNTSTLDFLNNLDAPKSQIVDLPIALIDPDPNQPRTAFNAIDGMVAPEVQEALQELADDIAENTQLQPIIVKEMDDGRYQIVAGERRWRAFRLNNSQGVPNSETIQAIIRQDLANAKLRLTQLSENLQREQLTDIEVATFLKAILEEFPELQKQDLAKLLKRNSQYISRILALVDPRWADVVQTGIITYASLLEQFKALPEHKQAELKKKAVEENRPLTSGDMKRARDEHKNGDGTGLVAPVVPKVGSAAEAMSKLGLRDPQTVDLVSGKTDADAKDGSQGPSGVDPSLASAVQNLIDDFAPKNENYRPSTAALTPSTEDGKKISDHGGDMVIPRDAGTLSSALLEKRELKLTVNQLVTLSGETNGLGGHIVSMLLPVEELRQAIQSLNGEVPDDDNRLVMTLVQLLNQKAK